MKHRKRIAPKIGLMLAALLLAACAASPTTPLAVSPQGAATRTPQATRTSAPEATRTSTAEETSTPTAQPAGDISTLDARQETALDAIFNEYIERFRLTGLEVGIVLQDEIVYARGFGVRNSETKEPVTAESLFHMASISKPFVATGIMQLVELGKVELDEPVVTYLPYFKLDDERYPQITIRQILSHVSGMPDVEDYRWDQPEYDDQALERYVRSLADQEMLFAPGEEFSYSNMAYEVLGDVIAKVSGMSFEDYMQEHIFTPLEMKDSTFLKEEVPPELATTPHYGSGSPTNVYPYHRAHAPSSTLHSNVLDMANWAIANMNRGTWKDRQILSEASYDLMWQPQMQISEARAIGLGWFIETSEEGLRIFHGGADVGFRSMLVMLPEKSTAVVILANNERADPREMAEKVLEAIFASEP